MTVDKVRLLPYNVNCKDYLLGGFSGLASYSYYSIL